MERCSLHPFDIEQVRRYVAAVISPAPAVDADVPASWIPLLEPPRQGYRAAEEGRLSGLDRISYGLAQVLTTIEPVFAAPGFGFTLWEARVDRGVGMRLRPPSRLFTDAGLDIELARSLPIRLDLAGGMMGGAYVPARLVPDLETFLRAKVERLIRRLNDSELDGVAVLGLMIEACVFARERSLGLYEAMDVVIADAPEALPPGARIVTADRKLLDPALRKTLLEAEKATKPPSLIRRVFRRHPRPTNTNGRVPGV